MTTRWQGIRNVSKKSMNVRALPNLTGRVVATMEPSSEWQMLYDGNAFAVQAKNNNYTWARIRQGEITGYVATEAFVWDLVTRHEYSDGDTVRREADANTDSAKLIELLDEFAKLRLQTDAIGKAADDRLANAEDRLELVVGVLSAIMENHKAQDALREREYRLHAELRDHMHSLWTLVKHRDTAVTAHELPGHKTDKAS